MLKHPLILKLFALLLIINPILRVLFLAMEKGFTPWEVVLASCSEGFSGIFNFWVLFPLSGLLLLSVNIYSYLVFILIQFYSLYFHLNYEPDTWPYLADRPTTAAIILLSINLLMVIYLLLPRSREIFFDKSLRWWQRGSRYTINEPCFALISEKEFQGNISDLSFGGALITFKEAIDIDKPIQLNFEILGKNILIDAQIVRAMEDLEGNLNYGVQFIFRNAWERFKLKLLMVSISKIKDYEKFR